MEKLKENRGITLISLIITIIVMLILVAVTINVVINSGLIGKTKNAGEDYKTAAEKESKLNNVTIGEKEYSNLSDYVNGKGNDDDDLPKVTAGERADENSNYTEGGKTAVIPAGFTVSGVDTEKTIDGGLVIYLIPKDETVDWTDGEAVATAQQKYDQFVWIPISHTQINDMYICQGKTTSNGECTIEVKDGVATCTNEEHSNVVDGVNKNTLMAGYLYSDAAMTKKITTYTSGSSYREPDTVSSYDGNSTYLGYLSAILEPNATTKEYTSIENFKAKLQEEYNEVVKSVYLNEGFYVGRYETSNFTTTSGEAVKVVKGTTNGINKINWYYMYAQQVKYAENNKLSVGSTMIQGAAYDQVMKFVDTANFSVTDTTNNGVNHSYSEPQKTGSQSKDQSKNIFDLEGNVVAWTTEARYTDSRVNRGGNYSSSVSASCCDYYINILPDYSYIFIGSLAQLYVK